MLFQEEFKVLEVGEGKGNFKARSDRYGENDNGSHKTDSMSMKSNKAMTETTMRADVPRNSKDDLKLVDLLMQTGQINGPQKDVSI